MKKSKAFDAIKKLLDEKNIVYVIHQHDKVYTVDDVKRKVDYDYTCGFKTLAFVVNADYYFVVINALDKVDYKKLASAMGVKRKAIRLAKLDELASKFAYDLGGLSPIPLDSTIKVLFDKKISQISRVYCGVGDNDKSLEISNEDLIKISSGIVCDIC